MNFSSIFKLLVVFLVFSQLLAQETPSRSDEEKLTSSGEETRQLEVSTETENKVEGDGNNLRFLPVCRKYGIGCWTNADCCSKFCDAAVTRTCQ